MSIGWCGAKLPHHCRHPKGLSTSKDAAVTSITFDIIVDILSDATDEGIIGYPQSLLAFQLSGWTCA
jgi:hypothetical protein